MQNIQDVKESLRPDQPQVGEPSVVAEPERDVQFYRQAILPHLNPEIFEPNLRRFFGYGSCLLGSVGAYLAIVFWAEHWAIKLGLGLLLGYFNGILAFITHELMHGSITKNKSLQNFFGFIGLTPMFISPTYWVESHNKLHHARTQVTIRDPDAYPTLRVYKSSKFLQMMFRFTPGSGYLRSYFYFFYGFLFHQTASQVSLRFKNGNYSRLNHHRATIELCVQFVIIASLMAFAGVENWLWMFVIPFAVQNYVLTSHIATNHNLSPMATNNDPLDVSLTVTNHPVLEFLTVNFGYHVEHHLFPSINGRYTKEVHKILVKLFPNEYKYMPKWQAMKLLYSTPRIYKNARELIHPETLKVYKTI